MKQTARNPAVVIVFILALLALTVSACSRDGRSNSAKPESMEGRLQAKQRPAETEAPAGRISVEQQTPAASPTPIPEPMPTREPAKAPAAISQRTAYLTFDDGPSDNTEQILAILRRYGIKATFFVIGNDTEKGRRLYRQIADEGHTLGNHTYSHRYERVYGSPAAFRRDVEKLNELLLETTGRRPELLRFPGGSNNKLSRRYGGKGIMEKVIREMTNEGYAYFDWNVSSTDAARSVQPKDEIVSAVLGASRGKKDIIVLMHDVSVKKTTVEALPEVIRGLIAQGFAFQPLHKDSFTFRFMTL